MQSDASEIVHAPITIWRTADAWRHNELGPDVVARNHESVLSATPRAAAARLRGADQCLTSSSTMAPVGSGSCGFNLVWVSSPQLATFMILAA